MNKTLVAPKQHAQLADEGFFITPPLIDESSLLDLKREFDRLATAGDTRAGGTFASSLHQSSDVCRDFCRHPVLAQLCRELLGPDVYQTWNQMIVKRPREATEFGWHQDAYYGVYMPDGSSGPESPDDDFVRGVVTFWLAVSETTVENGTLRVLPGAHRRGLLPHHWDPVKREWQGLYDTTAAVPVILAPGQMVVFTRLTPHASGANRTGAPRYAYQIGYEAKPGIRDRLPFLRDGVICAVGSA